MAPPDVQLAERQAGHRTGPREAPEKRRDREIRHRTQKTVQEDGRGRREHRVIEVRSPAIVMRSQMKREPKMLRNVIEKRRRKISGDERDYESDSKIRCGGDLVV
jgi:hypothetical protein